MPEGFPPAAQAHAAAAPAGMTRVAAVPPATVRPPSPTTTPAAGAGARTATRGQRLGLALGVLATLLLALWLFSSVLTPFVLAACVAYFLDPVATRLARVGLPRGAAAALLVFLLCAAALLGLLLLYPLLIAQVGVLLARLPSYVARIGATLRDALEAAAQAFGPEAFDGRLQELAVGQVGSILSYLGASAARLIGGGYAVFGVFTFAVVTPVVAFYLLRDWPRIVLRVESWLPRRYAPTARALARDTDRVLSAWLRGQLLLCGLLAVYYALALQAVGLELGLIVGLMAGVLSFVPYVGSLTGMASAVLLALGQFGDWGGVALVVVVFLLGQTVEGYVIYPRVMGDRVELHAVWVIFALFAGGVAFGFLGVLLAVPMAAVAGVVARHWLRRYLASPLYLDPPRTGGA